MSPLAPEVVGPISVCSTSVEVRANIAGATIEILANGAVITSQVTTVADSYYNLTTALQAGQKVTARQTFGGATSPESLPVVVQGVPQTLNPLTLWTHPHTCGRALAATGAVPGAAVDAEIGTQTVGSTHAAGGEVGFTYDPALSTGQTLTLRQTACNNATAAQSSPPATAPPMNLPAPVIQVPLLECQNSIVIGGIIDGAAVEMYRNDALENTFIFGVSQEYFWIKPLVKNDVIKVRQGFKCKSPSSPLETSSPFTSVKVQPIDALPAPQFLGTPCPGTTYVTLSNLTIGARVVISSNGQELGETDAPAVSYTFTIPPAQAGATLEAHMQMCNHTGPSATVIVSSQGQSPLAVKISDPYGCAAYVYVKADGNIGNYLVYIANKSGQQISAYYNLIGFDALIPVSPSLIAGDQITVNLQGCGGAFTAYGPFTVLGGAPQPNLVQPVEAGYNFCDVASPAAGAVLDVYVDNVWQGWAISNGNLAATSVLLGVTLQLGQQVYCTQTLCAQTSKPTPPVKVAKQSPKKPVLLQPPDGATSVGLQPTFKWQDPGAGTPAAADWFQLVVSTTSGNVAISAPGLGATSYQGTPLEYGTGYTWTVAAVNTSGMAQPDQPFSFHTLPAPPPPPPPQPTLHLVPPIASLDYGSFPRGIWFNISIGVQNGGTTPSPAFSVEFVLKNHNDTVVFAQDTKMESSLAAGATLQVLELIELSSADTVFIHVYLVVNNVKVDQAVRPV